MSFVAPTFSPFFTFFLISPPTSFHLRHPPSAVLLSHLFSSCLFNFLLFLLLSLYSDPLFPHSTFLFFFLSSILFTIIPASYSPPSSVFMLPLYSDLFKTPSSLSCHLYAPSIFLTLFLQSHLFLSSLPPSHFPLLHCYSSPVSLFS